MTERVEAQLRTLQAKAIALQNRLTDLKDRRDRGRLDDGRFTDLSADLDKERVEILLRLQTLVGRKDEEFDTLLANAIGGQDEENLGGELADLVEKKGLGSKMAEQIRKHRGAIVSWIVNVGLEIIRQAT